MSKKQAQNFRLLKALLSQLRAFGLNPKDWRIVRDASDASDNLIELRHRHDTDFRVTGRIRQSTCGRPDWAQLTLASW